jgi:tetratricopeptide (TPR) repeat protein
MLQRLPVRAAALAALLGACSPGPAPTVTADYVGRASCAECHAEATEAWTGSHHDLAMQEATPATVLGDFDGARMEHFGVVSTFRRDGERFLVTTDGPDGSMTEYEVAYVFGVFPLQQYLAAFPGGRYQVLPTCWDARPEAEGGQRWFHLYPDHPVPAGDVLHWTGPNQNWNHVCAECHSTDLRKGYDEANDTFTTTWSELDVSCEACHGPGSAHAAWAEGRGEGPLRPGEDPRLLVDTGDGPGNWVFDEGATTARREPPLAAPGEVEVCARCHSRRSQIAEFEPGQPFLDTHRPALLEEGLYHADGQILDEVYVWGSFAQSRMYAAGVRCSDCHDPHGLDPWSSGDAVCLRCHSPAPYQSREHHFHDPLQEGASCVECHMPETTYMVVDPRRDHSIRVPRPDLSLTTGAPNACSRCHEKEGPAWAAAKMDEWYGSDWRRPHPATAIHAARQGAAEAPALLAELARDPERPAIIRATAVSLLRRAADADSLAVVQEAASDPEPLLRLAALLALADAELQVTASLAFPLLEDPVRAVRIEAARLTASLPAGQLPEHWRGVWDRAQEEYRASLTVDADRAGARLNRALLHLAQRREDLAEREYRAGLRLDPAHVGCAVNLADLLREQERDAEGEAVLRSLLERVPDAAAAHHALGLLLVREGRKEEALRALQASVDHAPDEARYRYLLAVALEDLGRREDALREARVGAARHPGDPSFPQLLEAWRPR